jgi:hypothetical protein
MRFMYFIIVIGLTIVLPILTAVTEFFSLHFDAPFLTLLGEAYVFFAGGARLLLAGLRQVAQPGFTLKEIFQIENREAEHIVQELGFANIAIGALCLASFWVGGLSAAGAIVAGLYYGFAGLRHIFSKGRNAKQNLAMCTDILVFLVLAAYIASSYGVPLPGST